MLVHAQTLDGGVLSYATSITDLRFFDFGSGPVLVALGGDGLSLLTLDAAGSLSVASEAALFGFPAAGITPQLARGVGNGLFVGAQAGAGTAISVTGGTQFGGWTAGTAPEPLIAPARLDLGGTSYLFGALASGGIVTWRIDPGDTLTEIARLPDPGSGLLQGIADMTTVDVGGTGYVVAASQTAHSIAAFEVGADGSLTETGRLGAAEGLGMAQPGDLAAIEVAGTDYVIAAGAGSGTLSVLALRAGGALTYADHVNDTGETRFAGTAALDALLIGAFAFVAAGGADDGASLFALLPSGRLVHLASFEDTLATALTNTDAIALAEAGGALQLIAAGTGEAGLTRLTHDISGLGAVVAGTVAGEPLSGTPQDDWIDAGAGDDTLSGGDGADILLDGLGVDQLAGGAGADLFIFSEDGQIDRITDFEPGADRIDLSSWSFFQTADQLTIVLTATGAVVTFGSETLEVENSLAQPLALSDFAAAIVSGPDRPNFMTVGLVLSGGPDDDILAGGMGPDTLAGAGGADALIGAAGNDELWGEAGNDVLRGAAGDDALDGGDGGDLLLGGDVGDAMLAELMARGSDDAFHF